MSRSVFWALVRKDLYLQRGLMVLSVIVGVVAFVLMSWGQTGFAVGGILFLTASMASGIFIAMLSILTDRVSQSRLFALSLPVSGDQYEIAKLVGCYLAYSIPWIALTGIALLAFLLPGPGRDLRGMVVYALLLQGCVLALFSVIVAWLFAVRSEALSGVAILLVNILFSLFMVKINQPDVIGPFKTTAIVWTPFARTMLLTEVLVLAVSLAAVLYVISRRRDHV